MGKESSVISLPFQGLLSNPKCTVFFALLLGSLGSQTELSRFLGFLEFEGFNQVRLEASVFRLGDMGPSEIMK